MVRRRHVVLAAGFLSAALLVAAWYLGDRDQPLIPVAQSAPKNSPIEPAVEASATPTPAAAATSTQDPVELRARGTVVDRIADTPMLGATVARTRKGGMTVEARTDESGAFDLPCEKDSNVEIAARGYFVLRERLKCEDGLRFSLTPGVLLEGVVRTPEDAPADGAKVACIEGMQQRPDVETTADDEGLFSLVCGDGELRLNATHPSGGPAWHRVGTVGAGAHVENVVLRIVSGREIRGRVVAADGLPNAAQVLVIPDDDGGSKKPILLRANALGEFQTSIAFTPHTIAAVADDGRTVERSLPGGKDAPSTIELRLPEWETLRGRLEGNASKATVRAFRDRRSIQRNDAAEVRERYSHLLARGSYVRNATVTGHEFVFTGIEPGTYTLMATSELAAGNTTASTSSSGKIVIQMNATATLAVHVRAVDGTPVSGGIEVHYEGGGGGMQSTRLIDGEVTLRNLPTGEVRLRVRPAGRPVPPEKIVAVEAEVNELSWTLPGDFARVTGRVVDAETSKPVVGAFLTTPGTEWYGWNREAGGYSVRTDETGAFTLEISSLDGFVYVWHEAYESKVVSARDAGTIAVTPGAPSSQVRKPKEEFDRIIEEKRAAGTLYEPNRKKEEKPK